MNKLACLEIFFLFSACAPCIASDPAIVDDAYFLGPAATYNIRDGFYDFDAIQKSVPVPRNSLLMYG
ncbi:MAG: hypothetical protein WBM07_01825, partial [Chitinivibrionales bacterium]